METFSELDLPDTLRAALAKMGYDKPTPIQAQAIPVALSGKDVLGSAQTGTGKTAAFGIPMISYLLKNPAKSALVLTPTRELAMQVADMVKKMTGVYSPLQVELLIGGTEMRAQIRNLKSRPRIIVGTPGRVIDHLQRGTLFLGQCEFMVLDETDRMLDMGFGIQLDQVLKFVPKRRQTLMFSATIPKEIATLSAKYLNEPQRVSAETPGASQAAVTINQELLHTEVSRKFRDLTDELTKRQGSVIMFVRTKRDADRKAEELTRAGHPARALHGDLSQGRRTRVIDDYRKEKFRILVATDIAARGLDIPHIQHVINYDLPQNPDDFIHRIGRTGRAGAEGNSLTLLLPQDRRQWDLIDRLLNPGKPRPPRHEGNGTGGRPQGAGGREGGENAGRPRRPFQRRANGGGGGRPFNRGPRAERAA